MNLLTSLNKSTQTAHKQATESDKEEMINQESLTLPENWSSRLEEEVQAWKMTMELLLLLDEEDSSWINSSDTARMGRTEHTKKQQ